MVARKLLWIRPCIINIMKREIRFYFDVKNPRTFSTSLYIQKSEDGQDYMAEINWVPYKDATDKESTLKLFRDESEVVLQHLMDSLWGQGVRPSDIGTPGHLAATQHHLQDMRKLAFHVIGVTDGDK